MNPEIIDKYGLTETDFQPDNIAFQDAIYYEHPTGLMFSEYDTMGRRLNNGRISIMNIDTGILLEYPDKFLLENDVFEFESGLRKILLSDY